MSRQPENRVRAGFTLVELIVVMVIMAIAAAIIVANATGTDDVRAISAAKMVAMDMEYAQNVAVTHQAPVTVAFNTGAGTYTLSNASGPLIHPMSKAAYTIDFPAMSGFSNVGIASANFAGGPSVTFDEFGSPDAPGGVTVQAGPYTYLISVTAATGKITVTNTTP